MEEEPIVRNVLIDKPANEDSFHGKGHDRTARALASAISIFHDQDRAIGLDGPWGSGKSSVVEIAKRKLSDQREEGTIEFRFFTYDIWKSQGSSFRRSFLEHFLEWSKSEFPKKKDSLQEIEKKVKGKIRTVDTKNQNILDWYGVLVLAFLPFLPIYYFWAKSVFDSLAENNSEADFFCSAPFLLLFGFVFVTAVWAGVRHFENKKVDETARFKTAVSQTLLISVKHYENQKITQHIREIDPNDFEFQGIFRDILSLVQSNKIKVVIALDNIDRLPADEILDHWAMVRSVFSRGGSLSSTGAHSTITAVVPYDRNLIEAAANVQTATDETSQNGLSKLSKRELFSKTFDEILFVAPPVMSNSREFFLEKIAYALPELKGHEDLYRVYSVFNKILQQSNGTATPRQVIAFINELTGLYVLHQGQFKLPTVAVYIAYQDALEADPTSLNDETFIDDRMKATANDPDLSKNLAAMLFNVDPDLAFQVLMDNKISAALIEKDATRLIELSKGAGFDLRINDVILDNIDDWVRSDDLGLCITNSVALVETYDASARNDIIKTLVDSFRKVQKLPLTETSYSPYLSLMKVSNSDQRWQTAERIVRKTLTWLTEEEALITSEGETFAALLDSLQVALSASGAPERLTNALRKIDLPGNPDFLMGFANAASDNSVNISHFKKPSLALSEDNPNYLQEIALAEPEFVLGAYSEFKKIGLLTDDQLISVAAALIEKLSANDPNDGSNSADYVVFLSHLWSWVSRDKREEIELSSAFGSVNFYSALHEVAAEKPNSALAHALFLAKMAFEEGDIPVPTVRQPNNQVRPNATTEFEWFGSYYNGSMNIDQSQSSVIARQVKAALQVTPWLTWSAENPDDQFLSDVVVQLFQASSLPHISLQTVMTNYGHLRKLLGDNLRETLGRYGDNPMSKKVDGIELHKCPVGFITDSKESGNQGWEPLHQKISTLLNEKPLQEWADEIVNGDHSFQILTESIASLGVVIEAPEFRAVFVDFSVKTLNGDISIADAGRNYDALLSAIDAEFHPELIRQIREKLDGVSSQCLAVARSAFPSTLSMLVGYGKRITQVEKDAIVRHLLCPALEGNDVGTLEMFLSLGRPKVGDYITQSNDSTKSYVEGALKTFGNNGNDREFIARVVELVSGKQKAKSWLEIFWPSSERNK